MERTALLTADYLDIIFDHRNKLYGGYELRKKYPERVRKSLLYVFAVCGLMTGYQIYANRMSERKIIAPALPPPTVLTPIDNMPQPAPPPPPPVQQTTEPPAAAATAANPEMKVVPDETPIDKPPKTIEQLNGKQIGAVDNPGDPNGLQPDLGGEHGHGNIIQQPASVEEPPSAPPVTWVEQMPEFNGDISAYLQNNIRYPEAAREAGVSGRVVVKFVVNEDGSINGAEVVRGIGGGCDEEALRVVQKMPRWKPGKNNGRAVKVYFTLPVNFVLG